MTLIKTNIQTLTEKNIYSLLLFVLYKMINDDEYSDLSKLIYLMSKEDFYKLCHFYGGKTIKIPTVEQLNLLLDAMQVWNDVTFENKSVTESIRAHKFNGKDVVPVYNKICDAIKEYEFVERKDFKL